MEQNQSCRPVGSECTVVHDGRYCLQMTLAARRRDENRPVLCFKALRRGMGFAWRDSILESGELKLTHADLLASASGGPGEEQMALFLSAREQKLTTQEVEAAVNLMGWIPEKERAQVALDLSSLLREPVRIEPSHDSPTSNVERLGTGMDHLDSSMRQLFQEGVSFPPDSRPARVLGAAVKRLLHELTCSNRFMLSSSISPANRSMRRFTQALDHGTEPPFTSSSSSNAASPIKRY